MEVAWVDGAPRELERMQLWCHGGGHLGASPDLTMAKWPGVRPSLNSSMGETEAMAALGAILVA